jgi:signal peptidase I
VYLHSLRISDPHLGATLLKPIGFGRKPTHLTAEPPHPRLHFRLERIYRHGVRELVWPKLESPLSAHVIAEVAGGFCVVYGIMSLLACSLASRFVPGFVLFGFFSLAGYGVAARRRQALWSVYVFLLFATSFCFIALGPSFLSFCSVAAALPIIGAWKALDSRTCSPTKNSSRGTFYSLGLMLATVSAILTAAIGTVVFSWSYRFDDISMQPTILPSDCLLGLARPVAGAVNREEVWAMNVAVMYGTGIARVIGLPGDDIQIRVGKLVLNGVPVDEPYSRVFTDPVGDFPLPSEDYEESFRRYHVRAYGEQMNIRTVYRVPPSHYFVLNDNRRELWDSRLLGPVSRDQLVAKILFSRRPTNHLFSPPHPLYTSK